MSDWYRDRSSSDLGPADFQRRRDAARRWGSDADDDAYGDVERRAFADRADGYGYDRNSGAQPQRHRGYRLGPYGPRGQFGAPDYLDAGRGYGGALYENAPYERGYGEDRYGGPRGGTRSPSYGGSYARSYDSGSAFPGDNDRLQRVSDGEADRGHLFGGGTDSHRGRGPKGYARSDSRIHDDVADHLTADRFIDASDIDVTVKDGEVTLSGHVPRREDRRHAEDLAERVLGVKHVQNNLRVKV